MKKHSVDDLSWNADSFWAKVRLFFASYRENWASITSGNAASQSAASSALSSTFYSIVGTAAAKLRQAHGQPDSLIVWALSWGPLAAYCYLAMQWHSNAVDIRTAEQADIRQSILRRTRRYAEAITLIREFYENSAGHTRGLLAIGLADCYGHVDHLASSKERTKYINAAIGVAQSIENDSPAQTARILRGAAKLKMEDGEPVDAMTLSAWAKRLAETIGAKDQVLKAGK